MPKNFVRNNQRKQQPKFDYDENNPVVKAFQEYAAELDSKHDRHERIVKMSRDITIESKRVIFLLHSIEECKNNKIKVLEEAQRRLNSLIDVNFRAIARELHGHDPYQFRGAYSPGLQEFIEAFTFMEYMRSEDDKHNAMIISDWRALQLIMKYEEVDENKVVETENGKICKVDLPDVPSEKVVNQFQFYVEPTEYILGLSDLTGELMRRCINALGSGDTDICLETCTTLQQIYTGYVSLHCQRARELTRKIWTMRQSVLKAENVCYNVKVRGGEAAKWGAVFDQKPSEDVDEGFY